MKKDLKRTLIIAASAVALTGAAALAWWIIGSKRRNGGLLVIGNVGNGTNNTNNNSMNTNHSASAQAQFNDMSLPRGYRNNNPLNVRKSAANAWKGKVVPGTDALFEQFISMAYGYRCALYLIRKYIRDGHNTIRKIVTKWAPPSENNTTSYISNVASRTGINADAVLSPTDRDKLCKIAYAMAWSENKYPPSSMDDIYQGWALL